MKTCENPKSFPSPFSSIKRGSHPSNKSPLIDTPFQLRDNNATVSVASYPADIRRNYTTLQNTPNSADDTLTTVAID